MGDLTALWNLQNCLSCVVESRGWCVFRDDGCTDLAVQRSDDSQDSHTGRYSSECLKWLGVAAGSEFIGDLRLS